MPASFTKEQQEEIREQLFHAGIPLSRALGVQRMTTHEFFEFFREFLYSEYDLMNGLTVEDFYWLKTHMAKADLFNPVNQMETVRAWLSLISDTRENIDYGTVVNLIKSIYAMREHRAAMVEESLDNSIEMVLRLLEIYISGKGELL